jgi:class 3 adenylate cyclase
MCDEMLALAESLPTRWKVRVGINVGPVIAGVIGHRKYQYDVWGDTVNTAARMQTAAIPGSICVNHDTWEFAHGTLPRPSARSYSNQRKGRPGAFSG